MRPLPLEALVCHFWVEIRSIAPRRFEAFATPSDRDEREALSRYVWNLELCAALYKPLHFLEIGLRNSVHNAVTTSTGQSDWFDNSSILKPRELELVSKVKSDLERRGIEVTPDRIVAGLNFGFWTTLFSSQYEQRIFVPHSALMFPNMPKRARSRAAVSRRIEDARKLRNRVFHHEPIWHFTNLHARHEQLIEVISHISMPMRATLALIDNFNQVHDASWEGVRLRMEANLNEIEAIAISGQASAP